MVISWISPAKQEAITLPNIMEAGLALVINSSMARQAAASRTPLRSAPAGAQNRSENDPVGVLIWNALCDSMSYELVGDCYGTEAGLAQDLIISCLDITSVTSVLKDRSQQMLEQRVEEAEDLDDVYDEDLQYREDFVMDVLYDTAAAALEADAATMTAELTVNMVYQNEAWWIIADRNLLDAISGGILY